MTSTTMVSFNKKKFATMNLHSIWNLNSQRRNYSWPHVQGCLQSGPQWTGDDICRIVSQNDSLTPIVKISTSSIFQWNNFLWCGNDKKWDSVQEFEKSQLTCAPPSPAGSAPSWASWNNINLKMFPLQISYNHLRVENLPVFSRCCCWGFTVPVKAK